MPVSLPPQSRRRFFSQATAIACLGLGYRSWGARIEADGTVWALFSDTHINAEAETVANGANMAGNLRACIVDVLARRGSVSGVIVSGDCAHLTGQKADYETLSRLVLPIREAGLPLHLLMGNHDDRSTIADALAETPCLPPPVEGRYLTIQETSLANWFMLDSLDETNVAPGLLGAGQLGWLGKELDARSNKPAIIVLHHNLMLQPSKNALQDSQAVLDLVRPRRHVKAVFFGHTHRWGITVEPEGIHLVNLPPTAYVFKPELPNGWVQATLKSDGVALELRALSPSHPEHGVIRNLKWRA